MAGAMERALDGCVCGKAGERCLDGKWTWVRQDAKAAASRVEMHNDAIADQSSDGNPTEPPEAVILPTSWGGRLVLLPSITPFIQQRLRD